MHHSKGSRSGKTFSQQELRLGITINNLLTVGGKVRNKPIEKLRWTCVTSIARIMFRPIWTEK